MPLVEHSDPAMKRLVEEIVTEHLEEYQDMLLRVMKAWMLGTGGEALGRSMMAAFTKLPPTGGAYMNAKSMYDSISMRLFGADVVYPEIAKIANKHHAMFSTHLIGPGVYSPSFIERVTPYAMRAWQPWLYVYPPLVVDREKLASQIAWCLDPNKAMADWFYSEVGRKTGLLYPGLGVTRQLQAIAARDAQTFLDLFAP